MYGSFVNQDRQLFLRICFSSGPETISQVPYYLFFSAGLTDVIIYHGEDKSKNRGFAFLEYDSHRSANAARRSLMSGKVRVWSAMVTVDWADPISEPDEETMAKVCARNTTWR